MDISELIREYLSEGKVMQVATVDGDQPWVCTVYYVEDDDLNLYWLSVPERRHSKEIVKHPKAAVAVPIKQAPPVIGIQAEGTAEVVSDSDVIKDMMRSYTERYNRGKDFYDNFIAGKNQHLLYRFTPTKFVLFDEKTFPNDTRREWIPE